MDKEKFGPHIALVNIQIEISPLLETGAISGHLVPSKDLLDNDIKTSILLSATAKNKQECLDKLKAKLDEIKTIFKSD